jgi:outer membrane protein TolC
LAANARIGVARAAYFPDFNLATAIGYESSSLKNLFKQPSLIWSLGPTIASALLNNGSQPEVTQIIFDGGNISGLTDLAWAEYAETVANYRQTVLNAFQDVEDNLVAIKELNREYYHHTRASNAADDALKHAFFRYQGGLITYLDVVVLQKIALQAQLDKANTYTRYQLASINLIKALGGGWSQKCL